MIIIINDYYSNNSHLSSTCYVAGTVPRACLSFLISFKSLHVKKCILLWPHSPDGKTEVWWLAPVRQWSSRSCLQSAQPVFWSPSSPPRTGAWAPQPPHSDTSTLTAFNFQARHCTALTLLPAFSAPTFLPGPCFPPSQTVYFSPLPSCDLPLLTFSLLEGIFLPVVRPLGLHLSKSTLQGTSQMPTPSWNAQWPPAIRDLFCLGTVALPLLALPSVGLQGFPHSTPLMPQVNAPSDHRLQGARVAFLTSVLPLKRVTNLSPMPWTTRACLAIKIMLFSKIMRWDEHFRRMCFCMAGSSVSLTASPSRGGTPKFQKL